MGALAVVGTQWGDEGKGKIVDLLARDADMVVRYQGGSNAGHTVVKGGRPSSFTSSRRGSCTGAQPA